MKKNFNRRKDFKRHNPYSLMMLVFLLCAGVMYLFWYNSSQRDVEVINYSTLLKNIEHNRVVSIMVQDQHVQGKLRDGRIFTAYVAPIETFWETLKAHNIETTIYPTEKQSWGGYYLFLMLLLPFFLLLFVYFRQNQGGSGRIFSMGKSKARFFSPNTINVTFKDVAGNDDAKEDLQDIVGFLKSPDKFNKLGAKIPRGILLSGAPGNGKTLLAKAVAGEASCPFFSISGSDFVEVFVGVGASRVRDLFIQARKHAPCIIFIDEIDAVGRQRGIGLGGGNDEREQTLNQLLAEMDGFLTHEHNPVIILAATNRPDVLDNALLRPGRFDRVIEVPYPDVKSREHILRVHVKEVKLDVEVDLLRVAQGTPGFSGADLENLINEAALLASKADAKSVRMEHFEKARDKVMLGAERKSLVLTPKDKEKTAYHEAGHCLLNLLLPDTDPFHKVTIIPRGQTLGVSWSLPEKDRTCYSKKELTSRIIVSLGGLLAEKLVLNDQTSGVADDLRKATGMARKMVKQLGMSPLGPIDYSTEKEHPYLGRDIQQVREFSDVTAERIDREVEVIINACYQQGEKLLNDNIDKLHILAKELLLKELLHAREVYELLGIEPREMHELT